MLPFFIAILATLLILLGTFFRRGKLFNSFTTSRIVSRAFMLISTMIVLISLFIVASLFNVASELFHTISLSEFLLGTKWDPYGTQPSFGILPLMLGTLMVATMSIAVAVPVSVFSALFVIEIVKKPARGILKQIFEIPASIPSVVYGYFGVFKIAPAVFALATWLGLEVSYENAITAGIAIAIMIAPIIFSMACDIIESAPKSWKYAALALGATRAEMIRGVVLPYIMPGLVSAIFLSIARVMGETMIVVLVVGLRAHMTLNPLSETTTVTAQIVSLINGDNSFHSPQVFAAYSLGLTLFVITLALSTLAMYMDNCTRKKYKT